MSVSKKLAKMSLDDHSVNKVIGGLKTEALKAMYVSEQRSADVSKMNRNDFKKHTAAAVRIASIKYFVEQLSLEQLMAATEPLNIDHEQRGNNPKSKRVLSKRLYEQFEEKGVSALLTQHASLDELKSYAATLQLSASGDKAAYIAAIVEDIEHAGLRLYLESFSVDILRDVAWEMSLEKDETATTGKSTLVDAIMNGTEIVHNEKKKEPASFSKKKKKIEDGISYQDIFQHYTNTEIRDWCKEEGLKTSGNTKDLIERILAYLAGDKENTMAGTKRVGRRRKSVGTKKPVKTEEKETKPKVVKKAPEPVAEPEPEPEPEEEEEEPELDLDNLENTPIEVLRKYCEAEEVAVSGKKKKDYIDAILAYNEESDAEE